MRVLTVLTIALALLGLSRVARAGAVLERASSLVVEREDLVVDCAQAAEATCTFTATYVLSNPTTDAEEVTGAFYAAAEPGAQLWNGPNAHGHVRAALDGQAVGTEATREQLARMDAIVLRDEELGRAVAGGQLELQRDAFQLRVAPGTRALLVFRGPLAPIRSESPGPKEGYAIPAIRQRHVALGSKSAPTWDRVELEYLYLLTPPRAWSGDPKVSITVRYPRSRDFAPSSPTGWERETSGEIWTGLRAPQTTNLRFRLVRAPFPIMHGGPLLGLGPRIGRAELRARLGYELGGPEALIYGVAAETNFREYLTFVATVDAATPSFIYVIPSVALGIGVPVQLRKGEATRLGVRGQLTISAPIVSVLFPVDYYFVEGSGGSHFEGAFVTQVSF